MIIGMPIRTSKLLACLYDDYDVPHDKHEVYKRLYEMNCHTPFQKYYLTGSRFFGSEHASSDWDFFTDISSNDWLKNNGFTREIEGPYITAGQTNQDTIAVFKYGNIHVQIVQDTELKVKIQQSMLDHGIKLPKEKPLQRNLWEFCYGIATFYTDIAQPPAEMILNLELPLTQQNVSDIIEYRKDFQRRNENVRS